MIKQSTADKAFIEEKSRLIMHALETRSGKFDKALMKKDNDTAITATIIPFKVENNFLITYLMDNVASYKSYSWMFAGGHVKSAENEAPDAIAVSRAKTELGLIVKILNAPVVQDEMIDNMMAIVRPNYVYRFLNRDAKCFVEHGHECHMDLVYLGEIQAVYDENILRKCIEIEVPFDKKYDQSFLISKCNEAKNSYYRSSRVKQKAKRNIPDYVFNMLFAVYNDYFDFIKEGRAMTFNQLENPLRIKITGNCNRNCFSAIVKVAWILMISKSMANGRLVLKKLALRLALIPWPSQAENLSATEIYHHCLMAFHIVKG